MTTFKASPSPPVLPKPEGGRIKANHTVIPTTGKDDKVAELPVLREKGTDRSKMQLVPLQNDYIPDELMDTLTSTIYPPNRLGSSKRSKTPPKKIHGIRHTDAVWHHAVGRKKYKYFLDQPTSLTGAGRDISFLCDAMATQRERIPLPPMAERNSTNTQGIQKDLKHMETLIPEEFHIVKNKGVQALECFDDKFTVLLEDDKKMLKVFPSMKPSGRLEAVQLMKVMDEMMDRAGVNQEYSELTGLSQMQGLLELVRVEQNIYNIVFHELIRQVSVECAERGHLLAKLRERYVALLDRIPRQLKGLHTETLAQRALDRRLTEEIICFKGSLTQLNKELCSMREHDEYVTNQGARAQQQLAKALEQSQKNSDMVGEYHNLYEMQRHRLESQVDRLTDEKDLWSKVTYNLALKVIKVNNLHLANKLHVSEQTWTKTAEHFTVFLMSKDSEDMNHIIQLTEQWKELMTGFVQRLSEAEFRQCEKIQEVQADIVTCHACLSTNVKIPDPKLEKSFEEEIYDNLKKWSNEFSVQCERYGGEELISCQENLTLLAQLQDSWGEVGLELFRRHPAPDGAPPRGQEAMRELASNVSELHKQLDTRINGESGIHKQLMALAGVMDSWATKLKVLIGRAEVLPHCDCLKLEKELESWMKVGEEALVLVASTQPDSGGNKKKAHIKIEIDDVFNSIREFVSTQSNFFDCENQRLCEEVSSIHTALTRWMVDLLLQMVPDQCDEQEPLPVTGPGPQALKEASMKQLEEDARSLAQELLYFSKYMTSSCQDIVEEDIQKRTMAHDDTDNELYELNKLQRECDEWKDACKILLSDVKGSPVDLRVTSNLVPTSATDILPTPSVSVESNVHRPEEDEEDSGRSQVEETSRLADVNNPEGESESQEEAVQEGSQGGCIMKLIGHDGYVIEQTLGEDRVHLGQTEEMVISPHTVNAHRAFDALATVGLLQTQLLEMEARAQGAEERAQKAEEDLQAALEKIQDMERQLQGRPSLEPKVSKKPVAVTSQKMESPPAPKPASQKPEHSPKPSRPRKR
ncbi:axonemal dynein light chain domain-containing protein 1 [Hypomesus transpacificus]|uniref:axonemal dynein light chain domain-containing protein 1 n=1 Tax=Hypomesus transpacificus TaxID=137520 RepID=UPI001F073E31|nr:axonemal dynein light chain domain-containing protein 1 [Hypomesus transpacificus]